jgi:hypothetical protein
VKDKTEMGKKELTECKWITMYKKEETLTGKSNADTEEHRLNTELDLQILFGLLCTAVLIG